MPTYEYECGTCGLRFERQHAFSDPPVSECPECRGKVRRLISGGAGFFLKRADRGRVGHACSLKRGDGACCGRDERCGDAHCEME